MRSLYSKIIMPIATLIIISLTSIMIFSVININLFIVPDIKQTTEDLISSKSNEISYWLGMRISEMKQLVSAINVEEVNTEEIEKNIKMLRNYQIRNIENYESFGIISKDGVKYLTNGDIISVDSREYFKKISEVDKEYIITDPIISKSNEVEIILIIMKIRNVEGDVVGYLSGAVSIEYLIDIVNRANIYDFPVELYNKNTGCVLVSTMVNINEKMNNSKFTKFESNIDNESSWSIKMMVPDRFINRKIKETAIFTILLGISILLLTIYILTKYVKSITRPIEELKAKMNFNDIKKLSKINPDDKIVELNSLGITYNSMIENIETLIKKLEIEERLKKEAEYKALYSQIKPHFLYNTLETIQAMAIADDNDEVETAIGNLATLFRIGLSNDKSFIKIEDELKHLTSYVNIQLLRYGDKFTFKLNCDNINKKSKFMKFTLQPLVENAIYHGVKLMDKIGHINVDIYCLNNNYIIKIINTSDKIDKNKINKVNELLKNDYKKENEEGYGLYNVNQRLKLNFGEKYGVRLEINKSKVIAVVTHPILEEVQDV